MEDNMLGFVARSYRGMISAFLWLIQIGSIVGGGLIGFYLRYDTTFIILGALGGAIIGLYINILFGGFIANFLNMVDNTEIIANKKKGE